MPGARSAGQLLAYSPLRERVFAGPGGGEALADRLLAETFHKTYALEICDRLARRGRSSSHRYLVPPGNELIKKLPS
jgi:hypothetical protein